jgi:hypothetical protein
MVGQDQWELRGAGDARIKALETDVATAETTLALKNARVLDTTGAEAPTTTAYQLQMGTTVGTTNASGVLTVIFPTAFPTALVTVVATMGFDNAAILVTSDNYATDNTVTQFVVRSYAHDGVAQASTTIRVNWLAMGY